MFLSPHNLNLSLRLSKKQSIAVELTALIVAVLKRISVEYTKPISSLSGTQFTVKKSDFESVIRND